MAKPDDILGQTVAAAAKGVTASEKERQATRRAEALSLRLAGLSYETIGNRLGISKQAAAQMVQRSLEHAEQQGVAALRAEENARLDRAQSAIWGDVIQGDLKAIGVFLQISAARAKMNGLYSPTQVQMSVSIRKDMEDALASLEELVLVQDKPPQNNQAALEAYSSIDDDYAEEVDDE
ncbi:Rnase E [Microbacterium phage Hendrix]|uniref:Helix-turn-helix DNA binding domain protein n=1 Tax=Microbacterium phage Hendrix TaxID=2182341 RepID=A0A2U8UU22_9CAUD|nr:Rnase E [Microbacterium phage Hendrix]AWN07675.1 helix-turn-helix DNA binding domain protein [Microbacterium phage Hendrix]